MKKILLLMLMALPFVFTSCSDDDKDENGIKIGKSEYKMNYEDEVQIDATSNLKISYSSESSYVATVSETGLITGGRVGETNISLSNGEDAKNVKVIIEPKYSLYPEPIDKIEFGVTSKKIKEIFGKPSFESADGMIYDTYHSIYDCMFLLENDKLTSIIVYFKTIQMPDNLVSFLAERYLIFDVEGYTAGFINEKKNMIVATTPSDDLSNFLIMYIPYSKAKISLKSKEDLSFRINSLLNEYKK